jgi:ATP-dependent exoDNAse (exonuclease V) beta subunit
MSKFTVVRAGAGSGKTYDLCETVVNEVLGGLDPARILATTFTRKAAAELKSRIQQRLLAAIGLPLDQSLKKIERLELGAIGTVHSVGHQLLTKYAIQVGISPRLQVLEEEATRRVLLDVLNCMNPAPWEELAKRMNRLSLGVPQELVLELLQAKRTNRISHKDFQDQIQTSGKRLIEIMAPNGPLEHPLTFEELYLLAKKILNSLHHLTSDTTKTTDKAKTDLQRLIAGNACIWKDFLTASKIKAGVSSGADAIVSELRDYASNILRSGNLHQDIRALLKQLVEQTISLSEAYQAFKKERGMVDFTDLEVLFLNLLTDPALMENLKADFELVVVDEFQDTNPIQLAIFQQLRSIATACHWVGDSKQAIYGFNGADAQLVGVVWNNTPSGARKFLPDNYRSQAGLVQLVGQLFKPIFGKGVVLHPKKPGIPRGIERWLISAKNYEQEYTALAVGIAQLRNEGIRLRDIGILTRTNRNVQDIGDACKAMGLPVILSLPGLLDTREGALTLAGLQLAADRYDSLAAATILHILSAPGADTPEWLNSRLQEVEKASAVNEKNGAEHSSTVPPWDGNPLLALLEDIDLQASSPSTVVQQVIDALDIGNRLRSWGDVPRRAANLDALLDIARKYEDEMRDLGKSATVTGLITHLKNLGNKEKDFTGTPYGIDAITILTYHKSKGLEWPVVILTGLDYDRPSEMWEPIVEGGGTNPVEPLKGRTLRYWPWPFGRDKYGRLSSGSGLEDMALQSEEGQDASTREEDEARRLLYVGFTRAREKLILAHREKKYKWLEKIPEIDSILPVNLAPYKHKLPGIATTYVIRKPDFNNFDAFRLPKKKNETWLVPLQAPDEVIKPVPRWYNPSHQRTEMTAAELTVTVETLSDTPLFPEIKDDAQYNSLGNAVHAYLASLPSTVTLGIDYIEALALRCLKGWDAQTILSTNELAAMGERFREWINHRYPGAVWHTEVPMTAPKSDGGQWKGVLDLALELDGGEIVLIDHKSSPVRHDQCSDKAVTFYGQLDAYRKALEVQGINVKETWIHFPLSGVMVKMSHC